jgi:hypothetical protein
VSRSFSPLRRALIGAGLSASFLALIPDDLLAQPLSDTEMAPIGPGASADIPYKASATGTVETQAMDAIAAFVNTAIQGWQFTAMDGYVAQLSGLVNSKTQVPPSYLAEYQSAAQLIREARARFGSDTASFAHLMFFERNGAAGIGTRLGRCRKFVFDELVRHMVANGGFRDFGLVNYDGYISVSFYDERSYRRTVP